MRKITVHSRFLGHEAGDVPAGAGQTGNEAFADRVADGRKYDRDRPRLPLEFTGVEFARIASGCRSTSSLANFRIRSTLSPPQRMSIRSLRLSVQPNSPSPCMNPEEAGLSLRIGFVGCH